MQEQRFVAHQLIDPLTRTKYELAQGQIAVTPPGSPTETFPINNIGTDSRRNINRFYLKFVKKGQALVSISPQGTVLTSKSDRIQEVDLNITLSSGQIWWELFLPHTTLFLTVGVKDKTNRNISSFDFCLTGCNKLQFKLNVDALLFRAWINEVPSEAKPDIVLEKGLEWTPFIRIRQIGSTLSLTSLIADPEGITSQFNPFTTFPQQPLGSQAHSVEEKQLSLQKQQFKQIHLIGPDKLLLSGQNGIKLVRRGKNLKFNFDKLINKTKQGQEQKISVLVSEQQLSLLNQCKLVWGVHVIGNVTKFNGKLWISKTKEDWTQWIKSLCFELDKKLRNTVSQQLALLIYKWALEKLEVLRDSLNVQLRICALNDFDSGIVNSIDRNSFKARRASNIRVQQSLYINNLPHFTFTQPILSVTSSQNYVLVKLGSNKISVFSTRNSLFKIGDFILSKGIKKENELTECRKQAQDLKDNDFTKPSIYKILKNCLKYADKVKPPEKLIKQLQQKKAMIKEKEKVQQKKVTNEIEPDKQLQNTLIQMGFEINLAKKALAECKNASLEAAIELILSGNLKVEIKVEPPKRDWTCQTCTLVNSQSSAVCAACESPAPLIQEIQDKKEIPAQIPVKIVEQQIKSQKIEEDLKEVYCFQTDIGFTPLIVGGVFSSSVRFRVFCLNPKFYSTLYQKGDAYANLIDNSLNQYSHELPTSQIQELVCKYYDPVELKQKNFGWIPTEDYDLPNKQNIHSIKYQKVGFNKDFFTFKAYIVFPHTTKCLTFQLNTSNTYQEKMRSFELIKEEEQQEPLPKSQEKQSTWDEVNENCRTVKIVEKSSPQFQVLLANDSQSARLIEERVDGEEGEVRSASNFLHLTVIKSPQSGIYPQVSFVSPWRQPQQDEQIKGSLVLGHAQNVKVAVQSITLQVSNKQDKLSGSIYFSNDYQLRPLKRYLFKFQGTSIKMSLKFKHIQAKYIIISLEAQDNKLIELSNVSVYGSLSQLNKPNSRLQLSPSDLKLELIGIKQDSQVQINNYQAQSFLTNLKYDISFLSQQQIKNRLNEICPDLKLTIKLDKSELIGFREVALRGVSVNGFKVLSVNSINRAQEHSVNKKEIEGEYSLLLDEYLLSADKNLLQKIILPKYLKLKNQLKDKKLKEFITNHVATTPFDQQQKLYLQIFISHFSEVLTAYKAQLQLEESILLGLASEKLTAYGLELLLQLNSITKSVSPSKLIDVSLPSLRQIKDWKTNHSSFAPYGQKSIFSIYTHRLLNKEASESQGVDRIHQRIMLKKHKLNRKYIVDLLSLYQVRCVELLFEESKSKNKLIVSVQWVDSQGKTCGSVNHYINYGQWNQLVQNSNPKHRRLTIDLSDHHIQTRYLIVNCNFTLRPLNGTKIEIQSLPDREILPFVYGSYVGERSNIQNIFEVDTNNNFICKKFNFSKYAIDCKGETFYYEEQELKAQSGDLAAIQAQIELRQNKDRWVKVQMSQPSKDNIDFHYTFVCSIAEAVARQAISAEESISKEWVEGLVSCVAQDESLPIQQAAVKALKRAIEAKEELYNTVLCCHFKNSFLLSSLFKNNPLLSHQKQSILKQLRQSQSTYIASNCLTFLRALDESQINNFKDFGVSLLKSFNQTGNELQICELCRIFGWIQGVSLVFGKSQSLSVKRTLAKHSKNSKDLLDFIKEDLASNPPNDNFWIVLEELTSKGQDVGQLTEVIQTFTKWLQLLPHEDESEGAAFSLFERFIRATINVKFDSSVSDKIIKLYFSLGNKSILLFEFLKCAFLESPTSLQALFQQAISLTQSILSSRQHQQELSFLVDIFSFIFKPTQASAADPLFLKSYSLAADFLEAHLNFGGSSGCRNLKEKQTAYISIAYYLTLAFGQPTNLSGQEFCKLAYWYILNWSETASNEGYSLKRFRSIHLNVWNLLSGAFESQQAGLLAKVVVRVLDQAKSFKNNSILSNIYQAKAYAFIKQTIQYCQEQSKSSFLQQFLCGSSIFRRILEEIKSISVFQTSENLNLCEKEMANDLKLLEEEKPKDWTVHKSGAKQHVYTIEFNKAGKQFRSLTFQSQSAFWLSQVVIGFQFHPNVLAPKEITLETGNSLQEMKMVTHLECIPLQLYLTNSVKVYAANLHRPPTKKWHVLRNQCSRYIRLTIKSPYTNSFEPIDPSQKEISFISFLSINAFGLNGSSPCPRDARDLVETLQMLSAARHKQLLGEMLSEGQTLQMFQKTLLNISYLMGSDKYGLQLHKFLMRVCELNSEVGNKMLREYLQLKNPNLYSKIAAEIAGSSLKESANRTTLYCQFILEAIENNSGEQILPFISKFTQLLSILQKTHAINGLEEQANVEISDRLVKLILERGEKSHEYLRLAKTILSEKKPILFTSFGVEKVYQLLYQSSTPANSELLAALVASEPRCTTWFIQQQYLNKILEAITCEIRSKESIEANKISNRLNFLTILCQNTRVKQTITKQKYDLRIFEILIGKEGERLLSNPANKQLRQRLVYFIAKASLGTENEGIIGSLLKKSLESLVIESSQNFVAEIFLPLLNSFSKTAVSLLPFSRAESKVLGDLSGLKVGSPSDKVESKLKQAFKLASHIVEGEQQKALFDKIKQNAQHKWGAFKLSTNHGKAPSFKNLQTIRKQILTGDKNALILLQSNKKVGFFYNSCKYSSIEDAMGWTRGSFAFEIDEQGQIQVYSYVNPKQALLAYEQRSDSNSIRLNYKGRSVAEIYFDGINESVTYHSLKENSSQKHKLQSAQYWILDASSISSYEKVFVHHESFAQKLLSQLHDYSFFRAELRADNSYSLLREEPLYEFPSSITLSELKKSIEIFGQSFSEENLDKIRLKNEKSADISDNITLEQLAKRNTSQDLVLNMMIEIDSIPALQHKPQGKVEYLPRKGILKYFQENDGVKTMIKVIKKSIGEWKNQARRQKWEQYSIELQNFSAFPHFFSAYLKDKDTFKLLIDLLSGLPDKEADSKWDEIEVSASQKLIKIVSDLLSMDRLNEFRNYALKHDFVKTILERLRILSGIFKRHYEAEVAEEVTSSPSKKEVEDDGTKKIKKKKGVGYGNDTNSNTKWMKGQNLATHKKDFENIQTILTMVDSFLNAKHWNIPQSFISQILESSLLPYIEDCLRAGTLLQISKHPEKFKTVLKLIRSLSTNQKLIVCLLPLPINYQPSQTESIESLLKSLYNISKIFISCLNQNLSKEDKLSQELANDIIQTYNLIEEAIEERDSLKKDENQFATLLSLPLDKKYRELLKDLRFDYIDMKESPAKIKHHYSSNFVANYTPNHNKMIRLAQELADISTALPHEHTNAIFVRCDKDRVDFMQALIMGSNGTPYGHGAFLFDIYFDDNYPNGPPKVNLTTTGHGKIRFNPNLYSCGKVCLSLLGTWRGSASENWDAKVSTLLQAIIMSEEVYFNEPGFENEQGTEEGQKKNEAYSNIVRYGNVKFAMLQNIKNPPKGFEAVIRRHFYLKKDEIMEECRRWLKYAEKRPANYVGLVNDHNVSWSAQFKKSKTQYKEMLEKAIKELEEQLQKLPPPSSTDIVPKHIAKKQKKAKSEAKNNQNALLGVKLQEIDVSYEKLQGKELDINDEKVRDRWSRYIGAMGIDAVSKQSKADILIIGLGPFGLEVVKNIVLSGCRRLTICDDEEIKREDLSGGFFYMEEDIGKKRVDSIIHKVRELNSYVKTDSVNRTQLTLEFISTYSLVFASELALPQQKALAQMCREKKVKFISADCRSAYCRLVNDFGEFTVLDRNGEEPSQVMLSNIEVSQRGVVTLLEGAKHPFEDGEAVVINHVEGMSHKQEKDKSINGSIHIIKSLNYKSFQIGNTLHYEKYIRNGTAKNIKTPTLVKFRPFELAIDPEEKDLAVDPNLQIFDFSKMANIKLVQRCFIVLDRFKTQHKSLPQAWSAKDAEQFLSIYKSLWKEELEKGHKRFIEEFSFTCRGYLPPLCAFFGGLAAQEIIKAITQKFKPINSSLYLQFSEIIPQKEGEGDWTQKELEGVYTANKTRDEGFAIVVGNQLADWIKNARLFMIGAGAIGCELLKNLAMVGLGTGKQGKIVITDPDHIENSNLNRQFLFREKHISKPKSSTAAASILLMNPQLKGHIHALLERVGDASKALFSNKFFQELTVVANALDNVAARRYVDLRCVENKVPLFESGTLGPKGHVQVIIPYQTESYGNQNDPVEQGEIPHCTLKMFPEETLHCIEWARDHFGKKFTLQPKALAKFLDKGYKAEPDDIKFLNESLSMVTKGPRNFEDCINYAVTKFYKYYRDDVMQLLYTYPLDAKTKNGEPFWRLPKRPPSPIKHFNPEDLLHCTFVTSLAVLLAKIYQLPYPKEFRTEKERFAIGKAASKVKIHEFVPSDEMAKAILKETAADEKKEKQEEQKKQEEKQEQVINTKNEVELHEQLLKEAEGEFLIKAEEFQKDDDSNGHIDFIYSMANLRAINYKLDPMDWITTKLKAGRIVPALATTTSCVAGLQTLQICKYLKKVKIDRMRNAYLNLAVPSLQMSEPGEVKKKKISENLTVSIWDRWEIQCNEKTTFGDVYKQLNKAYGLFAKGVLQGMSRVDLGKSEAEQKAFLSSAVVDKLEKEENYINIVVLFTLKEEDDKIIEGLPPVRLVFKK